MTKQVTNYNFVFRCFLTYLTMYHDRIFYNADWSPSSGHPPLTPFSKITNYIKLIFLYPNLEPWKMTCKNPTYFSNVFLSNNVFTFHLPKIWLKILPQKMMSPQMTPILFDHLDQLCPVQKMSLWKPCNCTLQQEIHLLVDLLR